jgi:Rps23 Pro-64 3,4-dihydroxylase Tpa1-like proline 4-hydroxylase
MTSKEMLENLSDSLACDERILSTRERELLVSLIHTTKAHTNGNSAVAETIARTVGEVVMQRAYGLLGDGILRRLEQQAASSRPDDAIGLAAQETSLAGQERASSSALRSTLKVPGPLPQPMGPFPPGPSPRPPGPKACESESRVAVMELPQVLPAQCVVLEEFLAPADLDALMQYTLRREADFEISEVIAPGATKGVIDYESRRSRVLMDLGQHEVVIVNRIKDSWPLILQKLDHDSFVASKVEAQITASNDGDFFCCHSDNGQEVSARRELTFVYFFHREPKRFSGGELRIYDSRLEEGAYAATENCRVIVPQQNQIVFFASPLAHEITPVKCPSKAFADSRFTVNGWFHR